MVLSFIKMLSCNRIYAACIIYTFAIISLSSCTHGIQSRIDKANNIATSYGMTRHDFMVAPFELSSWRKIGNTGDPIRIYIEGDGFAWVNRHTPSTNPTPRHPIVLSLAGLDPYPNVVYIARPCQYGGKTANNAIPCSEGFWTDKRYGSSVVQSYHAALNQLGAMSSSTPQFELIGYSGGANIAGLLAAERDDISNIRTIAGNVDNDFYTKFHSISAMPESLNMADYAERLKDLPQHHFIGGKDSTVPFDIFKSYYSKMGNTSCVSYTVIDGVSHGKGWRERWPDLLRISPHCSEK